MIRILQCLPGDMNMGGIENFIMNVYRNIDREKVQFDFIVHSTDENYYESEIKKLGGNVYHLPVKVKHPLKYSKYLKQIINKNNYSTIHIHSTYAISIIDVLIAKNTNIKNIIVHSHNTNAILKRKVIHYLFRNIQDRMIDYRFSCGVEAAKWMFSKKTFKKNKYKVINNSIDTSKFLFDKEKRDKIRTDNNINNDELVIGSVGRLSYQKNSLRIIEIFNEVVKNNKYSKLVLIGDGELKNEIINQIHYYNLEDKVILTGNINNVNDYLQAFDIFLLPSRYEGLPIVLVEAQASGLKCIVSSTITKEVEITDLIKYIDLKEQDEKWANEILQSKKYKRKNMEKEIIQSGYDNYKNIKEIEKFYLNVN